jgi:hypothetical protein
VLEGADPPEAFVSFFERCTDTEARTRHLVRQLEALGTEVTLDPAG